MYWGYQLVVVVVVDRMILFVQEGFEVLQAELALAEYAVVVCEETFVDLIRLPIKQLTQMLHTANLSIVKFI